MKKIYILFIPMILIPFFLSAQSGNVGIGTDTPQQKIHIKSTGIGINTIGLLESDAGSAIWLESPFGQSKTLTFREGGSTVANISWNSGLMKIYSDYSGIIPNPTLTLADGYKLGINMGFIGEPSQKLQVNGKIKLGDDALIPTEGTMRYDTMTNKFQGFSGSSWDNLGGHWLKSTQFLYYDKGPVFVGRSSNIGFEAFGISYPVTGSQLGGMHVETTGHSSGKPFYGYALDGVSKMYHYFDGLSGTWRLNYNGDRMVVNSIGNVGIKWLDPTASLHVAAGNWNIAEGDADFRIGGNDSELAIGVGVDGPELGVARIYARHGNSRLILGANETDALTVRDKGRVGIGTKDPEYPLDIMTNYTRSINLTNQYAGSNTKYGLYAHAEASGTGTKYGVRGAATAATTASSTNDIHGVLGLANGNSSNANIYGVVGIATNSGIGNKYGVYAESQTSDPSAGKKSFALYAKGHSYFQNDVRIGSLEPVTGYKLVVDGKMISEELKVQLSDVWPDYVFDEGYPLMPIDDLSLFLQNERHLPGVPSADEVNEANGIHVGEMNRILLEKIEELTLYILKQQEQIDVLKQSVEEILNNPSKL